ncbi:MAG: nuclear transport factor 2 family protein [Novosphingobium sp.]|nr:nuclear transport factor 2 family protein [Novosphingobium sp.]
MADSDIIELNQLAFRYAAAVDACDVDAFLGVFHPDARLRSYHPDTEEPFADLSGHEQLASIPNTMRGMYRHTAHMMTNHLVEVDGDSASGQVLCTARHLSNDIRQPNSMNVIIRYIDRYERRGGSWKIADRQIRFLWSERHEVTDSGMGREKGE